MTIFRLGTRQKKQPGAAAITARLWRKEVGRQECATISATDPKRSLENLSQVNIIVRLFVAFPGLAVVLVAACTALPPDPDFARSGHKLVERQFTGCEPQTEIPALLVAGRAPIYPPIRYSYRQDGYAIIEFDISLEGSAENLKNIDCSHPAFCAHTNVAIKEWEFEPARENGAPVQVHCEFRQVFEAKRRLE